MWTCVCDVDGWGLQGLLVALLFCFKPFCPLRSFSSSHAVLTFVLGQHPVVNYSRFLPQYPEKYAIPCWNIHSYLTLTSVYVRTIHQPLWTCWIASAFPVYGYHVIFKLPLLSDSPLYIWTVLSYGETTATMFSDTNISRILFMFYTEIISHLVLYIFIYIVYS